MSFFWFFFFVHFRWCVRILFVSQTFSNIWLEIVRLKMNNSMAEVHHLNRNSKAMYDSTTSSIFPTSQARGDINIDSKGNIIN